MGAFALKRAEKQHKDRLVSLGCMVCRRLFPWLEPATPELHHLRTGGWGKGDYKTMIPLCREHHQGKTGVHGMGTKAFERHYGLTQQDLLDDALRAIG